MERLRDRDLGSDLVQPELERRDHSEVPAAPAARPEQIRVLGCARVHELAGGGHDIDRDQVVARQAMRPREVPDPTAERQAGDPGARDQSAGRREPERLRFVIEVAPGRSGARACGPAADR